MDPTVPHPAKKPTAYWEDDLGGSDPPPIRISADPPSQSKPFSKFPCNVNCERNDASMNVNNKLIEGKWKFKYSMESSGYYPDLEVKPMDYKFDTYYATTSFQSDIPLPYFSWAEYDIQKPPINYTNAIKGASFIAKNCASNNHREDVVKNLTKTELRVDSLSSCLHNAEPPNGIKDMRDKILLQQQYLFHLAFENTCEDDYITEKLWGTLESGTLPVYYGAPNVKDHAPPNSIISWHDFNSTTKLADYLRKVANNQTLYERYHEWRSQKEFALEFQQKYNFTHTHSICRMCRWGYAKTYGWGWNHTTQSIEELKYGSGKRNPCISKSSQLLIHPVVERWFASPTEILKANNDGGKQLDNEDATLCLSSSSSSSSANSTSTTATTTMAVGTWTRSISYHDGVTDVTIHGTGEHHGMFQLEVPLLNGTMKKQHGNSNSQQQWFQFQNATSRIHIWIGWTTPTVELTTTSVSSDSDSATDSMMLGIVVDRTFPMRIRILVEDVDTFHVGAAAGDELSYFASMMKKDFTTPVEYFLIQQQEEPEDETENSTTSNGSNNTTQTTR